MNPASIKGALVAGQQETNIALATLNFDFSLFKYQPPRQFLDLGANLSQKRKQSAEDGVQHVTARKLGALFKTLGPEVPALVAAYGTRVSEISKDPEINPKGAKQHGAFADFVGADGTSIWAAATSGTESILVHLLACMLARIWSPQEATSIWEELVQTRKRQLQSQLCSDPSHMAASLIEVGRSQLADWDASARAWLQVADRVKAKKQKQLALIIQEYGLDVSNKKGVFDSVMDAWRSSLMAVDKLVQGVAQRVQSGAILLGLSAWHIYPDMMALENPSCVISQKDPLLAPGALLTLGIKSMSPEQHDGVQWSLPLAYMTHYGDPELITRSYGDISNRLAAKDLSFIALGCLFRTWALEESRFEEGCHFLAATGSCLRQDDRKMSVWLLYLVGAADNYLHALSKMDEDSLLIPKLTKHGYRRCKKFLTTQGQQKRPFFGICNSSTYLDLLGGLEGKISFLRKMASNFSGKRETLLIRYTYECNTSARLQFGYASAIKLCSSSYDLADPTSRLTAVYRRWVGSGRSCQMPQNGTELLSICNLSLVSCSEGVINWFDPPDCFPREKTLRERGAYGSYDLITEVEDDFCLVHEPLEILSFRKIAGNFHVAALYTCTDAPYKFDVHTEMPIKAVIDALRDGTIAAEALEHHLNASCLDGDSKRSLEGLYKAAQIYETFPGAMVHMSVTSRPFCESKWLRQAKSASGSIWNSVTRPASFGCIALLESGTLDCDPVGLQDVMALSVRNSLYVASQLLHDPADDTPSGAIALVVGNIDQAGLTFLIAPKRPIISSPAIGKWQQLDHATYDGQRQDSFQQTSLHLSLTDYRTAYSGLHGYRTPEAYIQEALISVYDKAEWIADLNVLDSLSDGLLFRMLPCNHVEDQPRKMKSLCRDDRLTTSLDNWPEFLEGPEDDGVFRAKENWLARLAAICIAVKRGYSTCLLPRRHLCQACMLKYLSAFHRRQRSDKSAAKTILVD